MPLPTGTLSREADRLVEDSWCWSFEAGRPSLISAGRHGSVALGVWILAYLHLDPRCGLHRDAQKTTGQGCGGGALVCRHGVDFALGGDGTRSGGLKLHGVRGLGDEPAALARAGPPGDVGRRQVWACQDLDGPLSRHAGIAERIAEG